MPIVELDNGTEIEFPDDMSGDEIKAVLNKQYAKPAPEEKSFLRKAAELPGEIAGGISSAMAWQPKSGERLNAAEAVSSNPLYRAFYGGVTEPVLGASQYLNKQIVEPLTGYGGGSRTIDALINRNRQIEQTGRQKLGQTDTEGFDPYKLVGGMIVPMGAASKYKAATTLLERMGLGAGIGGTTAATMPIYGEENQANYGEKKAEQTAGGMAFGAAIPAVSAVANKVGGTVKNQLDQLVRPFTESGIKRDVKDLLVEQLGPERARVVEAMMLANKGMTTGQALAKYAQETGDVVGAPIIKLEQELSKKGGTGVPLRETYQKQQQAREAIINRLAGTEDDLTKQPLSSTFKYQAGPGEIGQSTEDLPAMLRPQSGGLPSQEVEMIADPLARAEAIRAINSKEAYSKAFSAPMNIRKPPNQMITGEIPSFSEAAKYDPDLSKIAENPYFKKAIPVADDLSRASGVTFQKNPTKFLHNVKLALDDMLKTEGKTALGTTEKGAINSVKKELVDFMGKRNPLYEKARSQFQEESTPINQMEVSRYLKEKLLSPTGDEAPGTFLRAAKDAPKTLKSSTGFARYNELGDVLSPGQVGDVNKVVSALERQAIAKKAGVQVESMLPKLESGIEITLPNMLSRPALVANAVLRGIGKNKAPEYNRIATEIMKDPQKLATLLQDTGPTGQIAKQIYQDILPIMAGQTTGRAVGE